MIKLILFQGLIMKSLKWSMLLLFALIPYMVCAQAVDESIDSTFSDPTTLTDEQMAKAKDFTHQGIKDREYKEKCKAIDDCKDEEGFPLESMIGKAYALLGLMSGQGGLMSLSKPTPKATPATDAPATPPAGEKTMAPPASGKEAEAASKKDSQTDYCIYGAMLSEGVGMVMQSTGQKGADGQAQGDPQLQALVSLRETHDSRRKTSMYQAGIYGVVTACYGVMLATGKAAADWKFMVKAGGAGALTALYWMKMEKHKKAVKKIDEVIASLELAGKNCNPYTRTSCFCAEATSRELYPAEYQEVCVLNKGNFEAPKVALGCASVNEQKVTYDKECKCKQNNSCLKSNLKAYNPKFDLGTNLMDDVNKNFNLLNTGDLDEGRINEARLNAASMVSKLKLKPGSKIPKMNLTEEQKKMADAMNNVLPQALANAAALQTSNYKGLPDPSNSSALSKLPASVKEKLGDAMDVNYDQGNGFNAVAEAAPEMPQMPGQDMGKVGGAEIMSFAEQAVSKADVSNSPETPIFDIISNRYRRSGWQKLDRFEE
jgi:hypothetical protein